MSHLVALALAQSTPLACQATSLFDADARSLQDVLSVSVLSTDSKVGAYCRLDSLWPSLQEACASHVLQRFGTMVTSCRFSVGLFGECRDCPHSRSSNLPFLCHLCRQGFAKPFKPLENALSQASLLPTGPREGPGLRRHLARVHMSFGLGQGVRPKRTKAFWNPGREGMSF